MKIRAVLAMALVVGVASPAHADKQICDSALCLIGLLPVIAVGAVVLAVTPDPPETAAAKAIQAGNLPQLQFVLKQHPELLQDVDKSYDLLYEAARVGNVPATTLLLDSGVPAAIGKSRLLAHASTMAEVDLLLARGANADEMDLGEMSFLFNSPQVLELVGTVLSRRTALDPNDRGAVKLLNDVVIGGPRAKKLPLVHLLLQHGVNPNGNGPSKRSILALVALGSEIECRGKDAVCNDVYLSIAQALIDKGADVNHKPTGLDSTPLGEAKFHKNTALVALLESAGARTADTAPSGKR